METKLKRGRGRPKGSVKMTIQRFADNPPLVLPKTDHQRLKELKELMIRSGGKDVAQKVIEIALNDDHPHQLVALKMCLIGLYLFLCLRRTSLRGRQSPLT